MTIVITDDILQATRLTEELKQELAVILFQRDKQTLDQASSLSVMHRLQFQHLLASRKIPVHYGVAEFEEDLKTLKETA